jgi:predicted PurR-regulated permease PerM
MVMPEPSSGTELGADVPPPPTAPISQSSPGKPAGAVEDAGQEAHSVQNDDAAPGDEDAGPEKTVMDKEITEDGESKFGEPGPPMNRNSPLYIGFVGAIGVLLAVNLLKLVANLGSVLTLVGIAAFIAIGLDPLVRFLQRRGLSRGLAVGAVFLILLAVFAGFSAAVVPTIVSQATALTNQAPDLITNLLKTKFIRDLDAQYGVIQKASDELQAKISDGGTVLQLFGGVLGAGKAVLSGFVSTFTVLVLTLYFLASLHSIAEAGYRLVPATRRPRVRALGDEIIRRIGGYVAGQVAVATINGVCTFILLTILGVPYAIVLSIAVAILGIIPLVGATLGAVIVVIVGLFQSWQIGVIIAVYYLLYQQLENYVIAPRIMSRTVSVPGAVALIAALAGAALLGVLGALIAIPIAAAILLIVQEVLIPRQDRL